MRSKIINQNLAKIIVEHLCPKLIKRRETVSEVERLTENFLNTYGFPPGLAAIDGTHIRSKKP